VNRFVEGQDRGQLIPLPECLDDYVGEDNPVRVVEAFVDELDLAALGFMGVEAEATGCPSYHPATLLREGGINSRGVVDVAAVCLQVGLVAVQRLPDGDGDSAGGNGRRTIPMCERSDALPRLPEVKHLFAIQVVYPVHRRS
jgi:hypothetical protein